MTSRALYQRLLIAGNALHVSLQTVDQEDLPVCNIVAQFTRWRGDLAQQVGPGGQEVGMVPQERLDTLRRKVVTFVQCCLARFLCP